MSILIAALSLQREQSLLLKYAINSIRQVYMTFDYDESCAKAVCLGYEEVDDPNAFGGKFFIKDGKIWIHKDALVKAFPVSSIRELEEYGYNVEDYYEYAPLSLKETERLVGRKEMLNIFGDGVADDDGLIYIADGVYMTEDGDLIDTKS